MRRGDGCTDAQIMEVRIRLQNLSPLSPLGDRQILDILNALLPSQIVERLLLAPHGVEVDFFGH
jgi:hypothetical protein